MSIPGHDVTVVGGGLSGTATAIAFADAGFATCLVAPPSSGGDQRSTALLGGSVGFLSDIGVFETVRDRAEPLSVMRIVDDTGRLLRAPTAEFKASEIGLAAFGYTVLNADLQAALGDRARDLSALLRIVEAPARDFRIGAEAAEVVLDDGSVVTSRLLVGADGRHSPVRRTVGIKLREWDYPQTAVVLDFAHERDHGGISTEFHRSSGPFTQVPLKGRRSSLVWVEEPATAALLADLKAERLERMIEDRLHSILGKVTLSGSLQSFALTGARAVHMTARRVALVGEAAHVFPPIGAQGLNLGLRDAAEIVSAAKKRGEADAGDAAVLADYERARRADVLTRTAGVDILNRSLLAGFLPAQLSRSAGLSVMAAVPLVRRFAMREGVVPGAGLFGIPARIRAAIGTSRPVS